MVVLALETSTELGSIAVLKDGQLVSCRQWRREKSHSELLTSKIADCLSEAQLQIKSIDRIAVGYGPGSFTGIRIAINAAKTFAYSINAKIYATDTFRILSENAREQSLPILGLLNAHKNLIYVGSLNIKSANTAQYLIPPSAWSTEELEKKVQSPHLTLGNGFDLWKDSFSETLKANLVRDSQYSDEPSAAHLGRIATFAPKSELVTWDQLQPLYIRASEPEEKLRAGLLKDRSRINE